ncbi:hypothetical protein Hanom_Chr06g00494611 [Helianthus anomalus]
MFVCKTKRTKFLVHVCLFIKLTNTNELAVERFTNCSANVWFVCSPKRNAMLVFILVLSTVGRRNVDTATRKQSLILTLIDVL